MKKYVLVFIITFLVITTSIIKNSTRELENKIFNSNEKIKILISRKEIIKLQNDYLRSPQRLFEFKNKFLDNLEVIELSKFKHLSQNE
tara:strand:+ start:1647 stop:1910 length:264 start_codon:yes stop_codon:yes gene_type:complete